jgi:hypothetical protein
MKLDSFKTILLRKTEGNELLHSLLNEVGEDFFVASVVDALEKMAKPGTGANGAVTGFGANFDLTDKLQLRDALGHHLSHYKAALKAHHAAPDQSPEQAHFRQVADQHLSKVVPLMHLASKAALHSKGELMLKHPSLMPWEVNYTTLERNPPEPGKKEGRMKRDAKGLGARPTKNVRPGGNGIPNYHYLEMPPHPGHKKVASMSFTGGYPWEEVQLGSAKDVDTKKAHLHIEDVPDKKIYEPHPFDKHPINSIHEISSDHFLPQMETAYGEDLGKFRNSPEHEKWLENEDTKYTSSPEEYEKRGHVKSSHFYEGIPLKEQPSHINDVPHVKRGEHSEADYDIHGSSAPVVSASANKAVAPTVRKKAGNEGLESAYNIWQTLPEDHQKELLSIVPGLHNYIINKKDK